MLLTKELCEEFFSQHPIEEQRAVIAMLTELKSAKKKHPKWPKDFIHSAAIVAEESGELVRSALQHKYENGRYYDMMSEAIQTGSMAIRFIINMPRKKLPS